MRMLLLALALLVPVTALAQETPDPKVIALGKGLAESNCATCHAIGVEGPSTLREAPPFRDMALNYDEGELEDALNEGVASEHPAMPDWEMTAEEAEALATYIMSLAPYGVKKAEIAP